MTHSHTIHLQRQAVMEEVRRTGNPAVIATSDNVNLLANARWRLERKYPEFTFTREGTTIVCAPNATTVETKFSVVARDAGGGDVATFSVVADDAEDAIAKAHAKLAATAGQRSITIELVRKTTTITEILRRAS